MPHLTAKPEVQGQDFSGGADSRKYDAFPVYAIPHLCQQNNSLLRGTLQEELLCGACGWGSFSVLMKRRPCGICAGQITCIE